MVIKVKSQPFRTVTVLLSGLLLLLLSIGVSFAGEIDSETCLDCHDDLADDLSQTAHRLTPSSKHGNPVACTDCHDGGEVHIEDPSADNITNPARQSGDDALRVCMNCHTPHQALDNFGFDTHSALELACSNCHQVHGGSQKLLLDNRAEFCQGCHTETMTAFHRRSNHPVDQGVMSCLSCHQFTRRAGNDLLYDLDRVCRDCHSDKGGPYLYEHGAMNSYSVEGGGCVECHEPHGSQNDRLLKQPGNETCRQCHVEHVTRNHGNLWDAVYSKLSCQTCHVDTHGSFVSRLLLDPGLPTIVGGGDCYNSGCHSLNGE